MRKPTQTQRFRKAQENLNEATLALQMVDDGEDKEFLVARYEESKAKFHEIALEVIEA